VKARSRMNSGSGDESAHSYASDTLSAAA